MNWKCPNCGKRVEFSTEQLAETSGVVVCPQCLSSDRVPGFDAPKPRATQQPSKPIATSSKQTGRTATSQQTSRAMSTPPPRKVRLTPPPHRTKINFADQSGTSPQPQPQPAAPRKKAQKKKAKKTSSGFLAPKSSLGCLWRSVVYTLILLIVYIIFGLLLQGL